MNISDETKERLRKSHLGKHLSEYHKKRIAKGLHLISKITPDLCKRIILARKNGTNYKELEKAFNLSHTTLWEIVGGTHWIYNENLSELGDLGTFLIKYKKTN